MLLSVILFFVFVSCGVCSTDTCLEQCQCTEIPIRMINCSGREFDSFPYEQLTDYQYIDFSFNQLISLQVSKLETKLLTLQ